MFPGPPTSTRRNWASGLGRSRPTRAGSMHAGATPHCTSTSLRLTPARRPRHSPPGTWRTSSRWWTSSTAGVWRSTATTTPCLGRTKRGYTNWATAGSLGSAIPTATPSRSKKGPRGEPRILGRSAAAKRETEVLLQGSLHILGTGHVAPDPERSAAEAFDHADRLLILVFR